MQEKSKDFSLFKLRILEYADYKGISKANIYKETGITHGVLSQTNGINEENLLRFLTKYTDLSAEWLVRGEGNMIKNENSDIKTIDNSPNYSEELKKAIAEKDYFFNRTLELEEELKDFKSKKATG